MNEVMKKLKAAMQMHSAKVESILETVSKEHMDSFYVADYVKKFHDALVEMEDLLQSDEFAVLQDNEFHATFVELIKYNRVKIPLRKKFEDTQSVFETYVTNVRKIIGMIVKRDN